MTFLKNSFFLYKTAVDKTVIKKVDKSGPPMYLYRYSNSYLVIWKTVDYNIGSAFNASTGTFTCPYDGVYSFYATSGIFGQHDGSINININGKQKVHIYLRNHGGYKYEYKQISPNAIFKLEKGDTVQLQMWGYFHHASTHWYRTYFQGYLIDLL